MASTYDNFGVLFVRATEEPLGLIPIRETMRVDDPDRFYEATSLDDASELVRNYWTGTVCAILGSKDDLVHITKFLQTHYDVIKNNKTVRVIIFSALNHSHIVTFLKKSGVAEVVDFDIPPRSITHKISVHLKIAEKAKDQAKSTAIEFDKVFKADSLPPEPFIAKKVFPKEPEPKPVDQLEEPEEEEEDLIGLAIKSFEKQGAHSSWNGVAVEMVSQIEKDQITIDVPKAGWQVGDPFVLDYKTENIGLQSFIQLHGKILSTSPHESSDREVIQIKLDKTGAEDLDKIQQKIDALQEQFLQFMKSAKG